MRPAMIALLASVSAALAVGAALAAPLTPAEDRFTPYSGDLPVCDDPGVLSKISGFFSEKERTFWNSDAEILGFDHIHPIADRPWGINHIPRRYCTARVTINDRTLHQVSYAIGEDLGLAGLFGYGVEWCVEGFDRNAAFAPACKAARP